MPSLATLKGFIPRHAELILTKVVMVRMATVVPARNRLPNVGLPLRSKIGLVIACKYLGDLKRAYTNPAFRGIRKYLR